MNRQFYHLAITKEQLNIKNVTDRSFINFFVLFNYKEESFFQFSSSHCSAIIEAALLIFPSTTH